MKWFSDFIVIALIAIFIQNTVLVRGLGSCKLLNIVNDEGKKLIKFGLILTVITTLSSVLAWANSLWFLKLANTRVRTIIEPLIFVCCVTLVYFIIYFLINILGKNKFDDIIEILPQASFNCAAIGAVILVEQLKLDFVSSIAFGLGSGLGFTLAILLVYEGVKRIRYSKTPISFQGMPATLIYLGILSLAFYGFTGYFLPF